MKTRESLLAPELLSTVTQPGLEVFQVTTDPAVASNIFYNYQEALDPSSRFALVNRVGQQGAAVWLCDLEDNFALEPVTGNKPVSSGHFGIAFSPDGRWIWCNQFVNGRLELRRRALAGGDFATVFSLDLDRPEFGGRKIFDARWLSFSHDGRRLLCVVVLEGVSKYYSMGVLTFDMEKLALHTVFETGPRNWNNKSQYAPCFGPQGEYLISAGDQDTQAYIDAAGQWHSDPVPGDRGGSTDHLVDEQGTVRYAYPVGRDRPHQNISHNAWVGRSLAKVFHCDATDTAPHWRGAIMLAEPVPVDATTQRLGRHVPGGRQLDLTRHITRPDVCHICVSPDASAMVCDTIGYHEGQDCYLYTASFAADADGPFIQPRYLLHPKSSWKPYWCECMPCFTPNKKWILFNSDYPGVNHYKGQRHTGQIFAVKGFELPVECGQTASSARRFAWSMR